MSRREELYLNDILEAIERINTYVKASTIDTFKVDTLRADAVLFNLMTHLYRMTPHNQSMIAHRLFSASSNRLPRPPDSGCHRARCCPS